MPIRGRCILSRMTIDALIMLAGAFVLIEPQLGFPNSWDGVLLFIAGVVIVALGIAVRRRGLREASRPQEAAERV
jgi:hypothetical protein